MRERIGLVVCILIGSLCVYCGESMMTEIAHRTDGGAPAGPVSDARAADPSCPGACPRDSPTVLFDDLVPQTKTTTGGCTQISPVWDVSGYRTVVIHTPVCQFTVQHRNGKAGFVNGHENTCPQLGSNLAHVVTIDTLRGRELRVNFSGSQYASNPDGSCVAAEPIALTVVAFKSP